MHNQSTELELFSAQEISMKPLQNWMKHSRYLYHNPETPWPIGGNEIISKLPSDWVEVKEGTERLRSGLKKDSCPF